MVVVVIHPPPEQVEDKAGRVLGGGVANRYEGRLRMIKVRSSVCARAFQSSCGATRRNCLSLQMIHL